VSNIFELTRDNIRAEHVDAEDRSLGESFTFNRGTELTIVREAHAWGSVKGIEYCTVQIGGRYFNIPEPVLRGSMMPKRP